MDEAFPTLRYTYNHPAYSARVRERPEWVKDTIRFEVAQAERLTGAEAPCNYPSIAAIYGLEESDDVVAPVTSEVAGSSAVPLATLEEVGAVLLLLGGRCDGDLVEERGNSGLASPQRLQFFTFEV